MLTDANQNTSKNIDKFYCEICDFGCSKKGDYTRHLTTRKHLKLTNANPDANHLIIDEKLYTNKINTNRFISFSTANLASSTVASTLTV